MENCLDLTNCKRGGPNFLQKGKIGAWKEEIPGELHDVFWSLHAEGMNALGYLKD